MQLTRLMKTSSQSDHSATIATSTAQLGISQVTVGRCFARQGKIIASIHITVSRETPNILPIGVKHRSAKALDEHGGTAAVDGSGRCQCSAMSPSGSIDCVRPWTSSFPSMPALPYVSSDERNLPRGITPLGLAGDCAAPADQIGSMTHPVSGWYDPAP